MKEISVHFAQTVWSMVQLFKTPELGKRLFLSYQDEYFHATIIISDCEANISGFCNGKSAGMVYSSQLILSKHNDVKNMIAEDFYSQWVQKR